MPSLLSTTFQITASGERVSTFLKPDGLSLLKASMQNHIHIVLERLLETRYGLYATSVNPDLLLETADAPNMLMRTYIAPMLSRREGGGDREIFLPKILQFLDDIMGASRGKKIAFRENSENQKLVFEYYPVDMGQSLAGLIDRHEPQDTVVRRSMFFLAQLCDRLGDGNYKPANKLH